MRRKLEIATLGNVLKLFGDRLNDFNGESRRSYRKAYSSFQIYLIGNYSMTAILDNSVVENWLVSNFIQGLTRKTVSFYLDKISSLYSGVAHKLIGGKTSLFKEVKRRLKELRSNINYSTIIKSISSKVQAMNQTCIRMQRDCRIVEHIISLPETITESTKEKIRYIWGCVALHAGVLPDIVKGIIGNGASKFGLLSLCGDKEISQEDRKNAVKTVAKSLRGEETQWFALRLRPRVKFDTLIRRFAELSDIVKMPELFYPSEEIVKKVGRKVVWEGKPVIRDIVFFKTHRSEIYPLLTKLYDLAWCYRTPGGGIGSYAVIPNKAMDDFRNALGFLGPEFEVAPAGEMELHPGDKVVIVDGNYSQELGEILKKPIEEEDGHKIYRVTLLNSNGHWNIGIDARLLRKV